MALLTEREIDEGLRTLPGWTRDGQQLRKQFTFASFPDAIAFLARLGFDAEQADHHPDVTVNYRRVTLVYSTHSEHGLTMKDLAGAAAADRLAGAGFSIRSQDRA
jgi:4a-hydroxytetrahydrobiopterin dehydratase